MNTANNTNGSKYTETRDLDVAAVAKLVRADIKALKIAGLVCSVRIERYSGGRSINVAVTACPVQIQTDAYVASNPHAYFEGDRYTAEAKALLETLEGVLQAYNYDRSDIQSDYFCVRFYGHATFSSEAIKADRAATIERNMVASRAVVAEAEAVVAACDERLAQLIVERAESARRVEQARIARDTTLAELCATAGLFLGNA